MVNTVALHLEGPGSIPVRTEDCTGDVAHRAYMFSVCLVGFLRQYKDMHN